MAAFTPQNGADIEAEWLRSRLMKFPGSDTANKDKARVMREAIPDCLVVGYERFIDCLDLPDPDDRHVLAAAIVGHADAIVTTERLKCIGFATSYKVASEPELDSE